MIQVCLVCLAVCGLFAVSGAHAVAADDQPEVVFETNMGNITIALDAAKAPITVKNFLDYVDSGHYNGTIFHRVINGFMIQGGGFTEAMVEKPTKASIKNESYNGLINQRGTIAMARTPEPDSASAQFFINLKDNSFLDRANAQDRVGYAVFGRVVEGMDVVDKIARVQTGSKRGHQDVPVQPVIVKTAKRKTKS